MAKLSKIKLVQKNNPAANGELYVTDREAIKKIYFNGKEYLPNSNGEVNFVDDFIEEIRKANILQKQIINYNSDVDVNHNEIYIVREKEGEKFSNVSMFLYDDNELIQLSTPTPIFETDDIDFFKLLKSEYPKYLYWDLLYDAPIFNDKKMLIGKDIFGEDLNIVKNVYFCLKDYDEDTYDIAPYVVYKQSKDGENFLVKQYVKQVQPDGTLELIEGKATKCSTDATIKEKNGFARSVEKK